MRHEKLGDHDFDALAEKLLLREAELDFPSPTPSAHLRQLYSSQPGKPADKQILPKARIVTLTPAELAARQLETKYTQVDGLDHDVTDTVDVVVGIDGHVRKAAGKNAPTKKLGRMAAEEVIDSEYSPLRIEGQPVQISSSADVTLYASPPSASVAPAH